MLVVVPTVRMEPKTNEKFSALGNGQVMSLEIQHAVVGDADVVFGRVPDVFI